MRWAVETYELPLHDWIHPHPHPHPQALVPSIISEVVRRLREGGEAAAEVSRQHLANTVWATATLDYDPGGCAETLLMFQRGLCPANTSAPAAGLPRLLPPTGR